MKLEIFQYHWSKVNDIAISSKAKIDNISMSLVFHSFLMKNKEGDVPFKNTSSLCIMIPRTLIEPYTPTQSESFVFPLPTTREEPY